MGSWLFENILNTVCTNYQLKKFSIGQEKCGSLNFYKSSAFLNGVTCIHLHTRFVNPRFYEKKILDLLKWNLMILFSCISDFSIFYLKLHFLKFKRYKTTAKNDRLFNEFFIDEHRLRKRIWHMNFVVYCNLI